MCLFLHLVYLSSNNSTSMAFIHLYIIYIYICNFWLSHLHSGSRLVAASLIVIVNHLERWIGFRGFRGMGHGTDIVDTGDGRDPQLIGGLSHHL